MTFAEVLAATWYTRSVTLPALLLWPLSLLYRVVVGARRGLFAMGVLRTHRLAVPVIVVGNLTVGGVGKTPLADALIRHLAQRGYRPGLVSRGYGGSNRAPRAVVPGADPAEVGDEALIHVESGHPVWIARDRVAASRALLAANPTCNVIIADDGLQHYALARTVEIAVIEAAREFGNGLLLPAGPLREPLSRLREVDAVVRLVTRDVARPAAAHGRETLMAHETLPWRNLCNPQLEADTARWRGLEVHAVTGIGHPQRFFDGVAALGIAATCHVFPDHHPFAPADIAFPGAAAILMTQKDAVKCAAFADERCWYLPLRTLVDPALLALVEEKLHGFQVA